MKKLIVLLVSVLFGASLFAGNKDETPFLTSSFPAASINALEASTSVGSITVNGNAGSEAVVDMYVSFNNTVERLRNRSNEDFFQILQDDYTVDISVKNGKLYAVAKPKNNNKNVLSISFKIRAPKQVNGYMQTSVGSIHIADLSGTQGFKTGSGSMTIENVTGKISGTTAVGSITVTNSKNVIDLKTGSGSITANNCSGEVTLITSVGAIRLNELDGNINVTTGSGKLIVENVSGKIIGSTSVGAINVTNAKDNIDLKTGSGSITAKGCKGDIKFRTSVGAIRLDDINGDINITTGSGALTVDNVSGKITGSTSVGAITVTNSNDYIDLKTNSGSVTASNINGVFKTETSVGGVNLTGISGSVEAKTSSGGMTVEMQSVSDFVKLSNSGNGTLNLTLPAGKGYNLKVNAIMDIKTHELKDFSGKVDSKNLVGTLGNGGAEIDVKAYKVNLTFK